MPTLDAKTLATLAALAAGAAGTLAGRIVWSTPAEQACVEERAALRVRVELSQPALDACSHALDLCTGASP